MQKKSLTISWCAFSCFRSSWSNSSGSSNRLVEAQCLPQGDQYPPSIALSISHWVHITNTWLQWVLIHGGWWCSHIWTHVWCLAAHLWICLPCMQVYYSPLNWLSFFARWITNKTYFLLFQDTFLLAGFLKCVLTSVCYAFFFYFCAHTSMHSMRSNQNLD